MKKLGLDILVGVMVELLRVGFDLVELKLWRRDAGSFLEGRFNLFEPLNPGNLAPSVSYPADNHYYCQFNSFNFRAATDNVKS